MKKIVSVLLIMMLLVSCSDKKDFSLSLGKFDESGTSNYEVLRQKKGEWPLKKLLKPNDLGAVDLVAADLSQYDMRNYIDELNMSSFSTKTKWGRLPEEFEPGKLLENAKSPGLQIKELHDQGINGANVGVAIIDAQLLLKHVEYKDNLKLYYSNYSIQKHPRSSSHGSNIASIIAGKNVGIAPNSDLYYIAEKISDEGATEKERIERYTLIIHKILDFNKSLPVNKKIRAISITNGFNEKTDNIKKLHEALNRAEEENVFVVTTDVYAENFENELRLKPHANPDELNSYTLDSDFYSYSDKVSIPMAGKSFASTNGIHEYEYGYAGGISEGVAYIVGLYAICCQINPNINPTDFLYAIDKTSIDLNVQDKNKVIHIRKVIQPTKVLEYIKFDEMK